MMKAIFEDFWLVFGPHGTGWQQAFRGLAFGAFLGLIFVCAERAVETIMN